MMAGNGDFQAELRAYLEARREAFERLMMELREELRPTEPGFFGRLRRSDHEAVPNELVVEALEALDRRVFFGDPQGKVAGRDLTSAGPEPPAEP